MKLKILTLTAVVTICTLAPVEAEAVKDFKVAKDDDAATLIASSRRRHRVEHPQVRRSRIYRPRYRSYYPPRYKSGLFYYPRRSYIQFRIGF